jgi:hypothetical protein
MKLSLLKNKVFQRDLPPRAGIAVVALVMLAGVVTGREKPAEAPVVEPVARINTKVEAVEDLDLRKLDVREKEMNLGSADPFAQRSFAPSAPPQAKEGKSAPEKPVAPALPFKYVGKIIDEGKLSVFLTRGDDSYSVKAGESIDGEYRVEKITDSSVTFVFLPLKTRQELQIPVVN